MGKNLLISSRHNTTSAGWIADPCHFIWIWIQLFNLIALDLASYLAGYPICGWILDIQKAGYPICGWILDIQKVGYPICGWILDIQKAGYPVHQGLT